MCVQKYILTYRIRWSFPLCLPRSQTTYNGERKVESQKLNLPPGDPLPPFFLSSSLSSGGAQGSSSLRFPSNRKTRKKVSLLPPPSLLPPQHYSFIKSFPLEKYESGRGRSRRRLRGIAPSSPPSKFSSAAASFGPHSLPPSCLAGETKGGECQKCSVNGVEIR